MDLQEFLGYQKQRYVFILKHFSAATFSSITVGVVGGMLGSGFFPVTFGPIFPYLLFSSAGFGLGSIFVWQREKTTALTYYEKYPRLIEQHIKKAFPLVDTKALRHDYRTNNTSMTFGHLSWLILGCQSAYEDIDDIEARRISQVVDYYAESKTDEFEEE